MYKQSSVKKSKSTNKIKPYKKHSFKVVNKSQKRPPKEYKLNNTENIKIIDRESLLETQIISDNSSGIGSNLGAYENDLYQHETLSSRNNYNPNDGSFMNGLLKRESISPKRIKSCYKKKKNSKLSKPMMKPYDYRSSFKTKNQRKYSKLPPKYAKTMTNSSEKRKLSSIIRGKTREITSSKTNNKIFKTIEECLYLIEEENINKCINKLIGVEKLCYTSFGETDTISIFIKYLRIQCYYECQDYDR